MAHFKKDKLDLGKIVKNSSHDIFFEFEELTPNAIQDVTASCGCTQPEIRQDGIFAKYTNQGSSSQKTITVTLKEPTFDDNGNSTSNILLTFNCKV